MKNSVQLSSEHNIHYKYLLNQFRFFLFQKEIFI
jgi:hypothetical protein